MLNYFYLRWFYVKRHFRPPLKLKGCWLKAWTLRTASSLCMRECLFYIHPVNQCSYIRVTTNLNLWYEWHWCHNSSVAWLECGWVQLNHKLWWMNRKLVKLPISNVTESDQFTWYSSIYQIQSLRNHWAFHAHQLNVINSMTVWARWQQLQFKTKNNLVWHSGQSYT